MDTHGQLSRLIDRVLSTRAAVGDQWPYYSDVDTGVWNTTDDGDWCGGHWVECLRIAGELTGDRELLDEARLRTELLRPKLEKDDQFRGHRFYYSAASQYATSGEESMRTLALAAAYCMRSMAIPHNGGMPIGHEVQVKSTQLASRRIVAVDNVHPNLRLDFWAAAETGDPVFRRGAMRHLDLTIRDFIRDDGSTVEFIEYHQTDDLVLREFTLLGAHDQSCWSRGQAWAIAGFLRAWHEFGENRYRFAAQRTFDYWRARCGDDVPPWDFDDPGGPLDTSAAAIVVEQLARMKVLGLTGEAAEFTDRLDPMLERIFDHVTPIDDGDERPVGMVLDGCFNRPREFAQHHELIWSTAYLLMALYYVETGRVPC